MLYFYYNAKTWQSLQQQSYSLEMRYSCCFFYQIDCLCFSKFCANLAVIDYLRVIDRNKDSLKFSDCNRRIDLNCVNSLEGCFLNHKDLKNLYLLPLQMRARLFEVGILLLSYYFVILTVKYLTAQLLFDQAPHEIDALFNQYLGLNSSIKKTNAYASLFSSVDESISDFRSLEFDSIHRIKESQLYCDKCFDFEFQLCLLFFLYFKKYFTSRFDLN